MNNQNINATLQLDKLVMCCTSTVENNFNYKNCSNEAFQYSYTFGKTALTQGIDNSRRYKYCYTVRHDNNDIGNLKFCLLGLSQHDDKVRFSINNKVFYNNTLQHLPAVFENLNLQLHNITRLHVALDNYKIDFDKVLRQNLRNKGNRIKLLGRYVTDRKKYEKRILYFNSGSIDNPFGVRTIYIKNKRKLHYSKSEKCNFEDTENTEDAKTTIGLVAYNKLEEVNNISPYKTYILEYHRAHNPEYKKIYRKEIRLESEELRRLGKKKAIALTDLLDKTFLYAVFTKYIDRIIVIKDSNNKKIELLPAPFLGSLEGRLPLPLPANFHSLETDSNNELNFLNENNLSINKIDKEIITKKSIYRYYKKNKRIKRNNIKRQLSKEIRRKVKHPTKCLSLN